MNAPYAPQSFEMIDEFEMFDGYIVARYADCDDMPDSLETGSDCYSLTIDSASWDLMHN